MKFALKFPIVISYGISYNISYEISYAISNEFHYEIVTYIFSVSSCSKKLHFLTKLTNSNCQTQFCTNFAQTAKPTYS